MELFNMEKFLEDVKAYRRRHKFTLADICRDLDLDPKQAKRFLTAKFKTNYIHTICLWANWADLSLDSYRKF